MSDLEREIARLRYALEQERREKEQERREKEEERREKEEERREKEQALERLRDETRETTLVEYLRNCHHHLYKKLRIANQSLSTTGFTSVEGRFYPKRLRPWTAFQTTLGRHHFDVIARSCGDKEIFQRMMTTADQGSTISRNAAATEGDVVFFEKFAVEEPVCRILQVLAAEKEGLAKYGFTSFRFSDNRRGIGQLSAGEFPENPDIAQPTRGRQTGPNKRVATEPKVQPSNTRPDGWGLRTGPRGDELLAFVYDYKAVRKVSVERLGPTLAKEALFSEVTERLNADIISTSSDIRDPQKAEELIAVALTQVFHYMVTSGLSYGYIAAGQSLLLLYVDRTDLQTLYCHSCIPGQNIEEDVFKTAVAQLAAFCLLTFLSEPLTGSALEASLCLAEATLKRWRVPYQDTLGSPEPECAESLASPSQSTDESDFESKANPTGRPIGLRSKSSHGTADAVLPRDEPGTRPPGLPTTASQTEPPLHSGGAKSEDAGMSTRPYCTQACLLGLKKGSKLDDACPNVSAHRTPGHMGHPVSADEFCRLVSEQLHQSLYQHCWALDGWNKRGAMGVLFKLVLSQHGYVFVAKGTTTSLAGRLEHEGRVYAQLHNLQGRVVPVHLGLVHLTPGYLFPLEERVSHMMLMSWSGEPLDATKDVESAKEESWKTVRDEGVFHGDDRPANYLWNAELHRVMVIDFDRAILCAAPRRAQGSKPARRKIQERWRKAKLEKHNLEGGNGVTDLGKPR